jgi:hypothetical protein
LPSRFATASFRPETSLRSSFSFSCKSTIAAFHSPSCCLSRQERSSQYWTARAQVEPREETIDKDVIYITELDQKTPAKFHRNQFEKLGFQ